MTQPHKNKKPLNFTTTISILKILFYVGHALLELKYEITLSADEKTLTKKIAIGKNTRFKITLDESRMMYATNRDSMASISSEWVREISIYLNIIKLGQVKDLRNIDSLDKEKI